MNIPRIPAPQEPLPPREYMLRRYTFDGAQVKTTLLPHTTTRSFKRINALCALYEEIAEENGVRDNVRYTITLRAAEQTQDNGVCHE